MKVWINSKGMVHEGERGYFPLIIGTPRGEKALIGSHAMEVDHDYDTSSYDDYYVCEFEELINALNSLRKNKEREHE